MEVDDADEVEEKALSGHEEMVAALARYLSKKRLVTITRTSLAGYDRPKSINGAMPDIEGLTEFTGQRVFGIAEECETYSLGQAVARMDRLSRIEAAALFLVVPASCFRPAKAYVEEKLPGRGITVLPYRKG